MQSQRRGYYAGEAAQITGIPYRTIDHWARTGLVKPSLADSSGSGRSRVYDFKDLVALRVARDLRDKGISVQSLRKVVDLLRRDGIESPLTEVKLLVIGRDVAIVKSTQEIESVLSVPGQFYLTPATIFDLRKPIADVTREVARIQVA